jgi:hypothetical protein
MIKVGAVWYSEWHSAAWACTGVPVCWMPTPTATIRAAAAAAGHWPGPLQPPHPAVRHTRSTAVPQRQRRRRDAAVPA